LIFCLFSINKTYLSGLNNKMPKLDETGPAGQGPGTGRKIGKCNILSNEEKLKLLGTGMGKRRNSGGGEGQKKRLKSGEKFITTKTIKKRR
jgi:hypothetical protein